ncbi:hypothetical protein ALON55S_08399 [Alishewanella longhuensis]
MVLCDKDQAIAIGRMFTQNAIYWIEHNKLYLVPVPISPACRPFGGVQQQDGVVTVLTLAPDYLQQRFLHRVLKMRFKLLF